MVAVILHETTDVFPHDVGHGRGKEAVFDVEGVQVVEGLLEGVACRVAAFALLIAKLG